MDRYISLALNAGFTNAYELNVSALEFLPQVREMCSADRCGSYGKTWVCPPACGTLDEIAARAAQYSRGVLVQTTGDLEDEFDIETMMATEEKHRSCFMRLVREIKDIFPRCLPMGAGGCRICRKCTYPDNPCSHPDLAFPSMEAYGLFVSKVCSDSGAKYYYGKNTMTYTSCILLD